MQRYEITAWQYWLRRTQDVGQLIGENWTRMVQFVFRAWGRNPNKTVRPEIPELVAAVKAAGCKLAILSNELDLFSGPGIREALTRLGLDRLSWD